MCSPEDVVEQLPARRYVRSGYSNNFVPHSSMATHLIAALRRKRQRESHTHTPRRGGETDTSIYHFLTSGSPDADPVAALETPNLSATTLFLHTFGR